MVHRITFSAPTTTKGVGRGGCPECADGALTRAGRCRWVEANGARDPAVTLTPQILGGSQLSKLALILAQEYGDELVASKVRTVLEVMTDGRAFGDGEFGFFSHLEEAWPRGQSSAVWRQLRPFWRAF
jgi:hypothetical protein